MHNIAVYLLGEIREFKMKNSLLNRIKCLLPRDFRQQVKRKLFSVQDVPVRLGSLSRAGFRPSGIIDGGAFQGEWIDEVWRVWPVPALLIEPQPEKFSVLEAKAKQVDGSAVVGCALGSSRQMVSFQLGETNSSVVTEGGDVTVECRTLDDILTEHSDFVPDFLKLDLQGYELEALRGASENLRRFEVILMEVSILRIGEVPIFTEVDRFMEERDFRLYDLVPQYYRPRDGALWQVDAMYVRGDSSLIASRSWD